MSTRDRTGHHQHQHHIFRIVYGRFFLFLFSFLFSLLIFFLLRWLVPGSL
jgi:hypothetical protein